MPAALHDYDYYEYRVSKRGTKNVVPRVSASKKTNAGVKRRITTTNASNMELKTKTTRDITKMATRAATREYASEASAKKKKNKADIDVPKFANSKKVAKPKEMTLKKPKSSGKQKQEEIASGFKKVAVSALLFSILFLICYRSSLINESFNELADIKSELEKTNTFNAQIESDIQTKTDLAYIENYAKYQLGMQKPTSSQIQKIVIAKEDKIAMPVVIDEEEKSFLEKLWNDFVNILD